MRRLIPVLLIVLLTAVIPAAAQRAVSPAVPPAPVLVSPAEGETVNTHSPLLQWTGSDATSFKVVVKDASKTTVLKVNVDPAVDCAGSDCSISPGLNGVDFLNGTFTWKVVAKNADGKTSSPKSTFVVDFPGTPTLISPADNATLAQVDTFQWNVVIPAEQYNIKVKNVTTGEKTSLFGWGDTEDLCTDACGYVYGDGFGAGTYKWWVSARQISFPNVSKSVKFTFTIAPTR